jgi:subtilisin-like proprotein convertase family protein
MLTVKLGLEQGNATVTAKWTPPGGSLLTGQNSITVNDAQLSSIDIRYESNSLVAGTRENFKAIGIFSGGSSIDLTSIVTWGSSDSTTIAINNSGRSKGLALLKKQGTASVTATLAAISGSKTVVISGDTLNNIMVTPADLSMGPSRYQQFSAIGIYNSGSSVRNITSRVRWTSSLPNAATISNGASSKGRVRTQRAGTTTIKAQLGSKSGTSSLTVVGGITLSSILVTPASANVSIGGEKQFQATGSFSNGETQDLTQYVIWSSSQNSVARVSSIGTRGLARGIASGTASIKARFGGISGNATITVTGNTVTLNSITITPATPQTMQINAKKTFKAYGVYSDGQSREITNVVSWTSSATAIASVSNRGLVLAKSVGSTEIKAKLGAISKTTTITVANSGIQSIEIEPSSSSITKGNYRSLKAYGIDSNNERSDITSQVIWSSEDTEIVVVDNSNHKGRVFAKETGTTSIKAHLGATVGSATITVTSANLTSITLAPAAVSIEVGATKQITATGHYSDSSTQNITFSTAWTSSNTTLATVGNQSSSKGIVMGQAVGSVTITAKIGNISGTSTITVIAASPSQPDPLYRYEWHLNNTGQANFSSQNGIAGEDINMAQTSSQNYKGLGIKVAVIDTGLEIAHEDLVANVVAGGSKNFGGGTDPTNTSSTGDHGTSVGGLIAATGWNGKGGRGVAPEASLVGYNMLKHQAENNQIAALGGATYSSNVDVFNMSYGKSNTYDIPISTVVEAQLKHGVTVARSGKGAVYVKSSGNGFRSYGSASCSSANQKGLSCQNANMDPTNASPWVLTVGAVNAEGKKSSYSTAGSSLWISAPGGEYGYNQSYNSGLISAAYKPAMMTTDQSGCSKGYARYANDDVNDFQDGHSLNVNCNYTSTFNGTSSAAPVSSGAIALIKEANPNLKWRDLRHILAKTSEKIDATHAGVNVTLGNGSYVAEQGWVTNAAGYHFHNWYGFGRVDVDSAVAMAKNYISQLGVLKEPSWSASSTLNQTIPDNSKTGTSNSITVYHDLTIEAVQVKVNITHANTGDLGIELTSPSGTKSILFNILNGFGISDNLSNMVLLSNAFYGEASEGNWQIKVIDGKSGYSGGKLVNWSIRFIGHGTINNTPPAGFNEQFTSTSAKWRHDKGSWNLANGYFNGAVAGNTSSTAPLLDGLSNNPLGYQAPLTGPADNNGVFIEMAEGESPVEASLEEQIEEEQEQEILEPDIDVDFYQEDAYEEAQVKDEDEVQALIHSDFVETDEDDIIDENIDDEIEADSESTEGTIPETEQSEVEKEDTYGVSEFSIGAGDEDEAEVDKSELEPNSSTYWLYRATPTYLTDSDRDGYYSKFKIVVDADTSYSAANVYLKFYIKSTSSSSYSHYYTSPTYTIRSNSSSDIFTATTTWTNLSRGYYDVRVYLYRSGSSSYQDYKTITNLKLEGPETVAQTFRIYNATRSYTSGYDSDGDGYYRKFRITFDADITSGASSASVYAKMYIRKGSGSWALYYTTATFTINGTSTSDSRYVDTILNSGYPPNYHDIRIDLYQSGSSSVKATRTDSHDSDLRDLKLESTEYDTAETYQIVSATSAYSSGTDRDGDGYYHKIRLTYNANVYGRSSASVYAKVYTRKDSASWSHVGTVPTYTISGTSTSDTRYVDITFITGKLRGYYDFKIDLYKSGYSGVKASRSDANDSDLRDRKMESQNYDPIPVPEVYRIYNATRTYVSGYDRDGDGYYHRYKVSFDADITSGASSASVYAKLYRRKGSGSWVYYYTTPTFTINGTSSSDTRTVDTTLNSGYPRDYYDIRIDLYKYGSSTVRATRGPEDYDLNNLKLESANYDILTPVLSFVDATRTYVSGYDRDGDGYYHKFAIMIDPKVTNASSATAYAKFYIRKGTGSYSLLGTTNNFTVYANSTSDRQTVTYTLTSSTYVKSLYDIKVYLYQGSSLKATRGPEHDSSLNDLKLESRTYDPIPQSGYALATSYNEDFSGPFTYEVRLKSNTVDATAILINGSGTIDGIGLFPNSYRFEIDPSPEVYSVWKTTNRVESALKNWTSTTVINTSSWNTLKVVYNGSSLKYYINGALMWSGTDSSFTSGRVGVWMYSATSGKSVNINWAKLTKP